MNKQLRQRAQQIANEHGNDAYSVAIALLEQLEVAESIVLGDMNKIKAEAVMEFACWLKSDKYLGKCTHNYVIEYVNKLENQNDLHEKH